MPNRSRPCSCKRTCGDVREADDHPLATCRGLPTNRVAEDPAPLPTSRTRTPGASGRLNDDATYNRSSLTDDQAIALGMYDLVSPSHPIRQRGDSMG